MKKVVPIFILSFLILGIVTLFSYYSSNEYSTNYKLGWPFVFYYQFKISDGFLQHGSTVVNFIYDYLMSLSMVIFAVLIFQLKTRKVANP